MGPMRWPNPIESFFETRADRPDGDARWANRIKQLIDEARAGAAARPEAALRLYYLSSRGAQTEEEREPFGTALWSAKDHAAAPLPAGTNLLADTFAELPGPDGIDPEASVRARLFNSDIKVILAHAQPADSRQIEDQLNRLREIGAAAQGALRPTRDQAASLFSEMTKWRPPTHPDEIRSSAALLLGQFHEGSGQSVGWALARMVVPSLAPDDRTEERARALLALISEASASSTLAALPYFWSSAEDVRQKIVQRIRRALIGRAFEEVAGGAAAIEIWASLDQANNTSTLPQQIVEQVISAVETRHRMGLHALLRAARKLVEMNKLHVDDTSRLSEALGDLITETAYDRIDRDSREATSVSLVRAECVRLARALEDSGAGGTNTATWLELVEADPLPEVRYALASEI